MAKVPFSKFKGIINDSITYAYYDNVNGDRITYEIKHYLPVKEKMELVSRIVNQSVDDNGFFNPMRVKLYLVLEMVYAYTNISFTDKMKEDPFKLYDLLISCDVFYEVTQNIWDKDWSEIKESVFEVIKNIYDYKNSVMGIMENISNDYSQLDLDATEIRDKIGDSENLDLLRDVLSKLG